MENRAVRPRGFSIILLAAFLTIAAGWLKAVYAADIEAVLDDAAGASVFSVKDSSSVEGAHIDSDGNMVIKGGLRLDVSGAEHTTAENLIVDGSVGIGDTSPASALTVGLGGLFQVDTSGDIIKLKNITYAWPSSQAAGSSYVLTNNGAGTLSWTAPGGISASSALSAITAAIAANTIANANFAQAWNWDTLTTETAMALGSTSITSGKLLSLSSSATGFTGTMQDITLSGNNAANTGTLFKSTVSGAASAAVPLMITNAGTGLSLRVNDDGTDTDTTPVVVDASGNVGIGTTGPSAKLHALSTTEQLRFGYDASNYWSGTVGSTGGLTLAGTGTGGALSLTPTAGQDLNVNLSGAGDLNVVTSATLAGMILQSTAGTNGPLLMLYGNSASPAIDDIVGRLEFDGMRDDGNRYWMGMIESKWTNPAVAVGTSRLVFSTRSGDTTNTAMTIDHSGNVGIGTTGPVLKLEARGTSAAPATSGTTPTGVVAISSSTDNNLYMGPHNVSPYGFWLQAALGSNLATEYPLLLNPNGGNVGIGTTGPGNRLEVSDTTDGATPLLVRGSNTGSGNIYKQLAVLNQNTTANTVTGIALQHYNASSAAITAASLTSSLSTVTAASEAGFLAFNTMKAGTLTEQMRIDNNGNVGIGTTGPASPLEINHATAAYIDLENTTTQTASGIKFTNVGTLKWTLKKDYINSEHNLVFQDASSNNVLFLQEGGNVGIGTTSPNAVSLLDVTSTTKGFLPPRMTTVQRDAISTPPAGLMIYNTTTNKLNFYNGTAWEAVTSA